MRGSHSDLIMAKKVKEHLLKPRLAICNRDGIKVAHMNTINVGSIAIAISVIRLDCSHNILKR